MLMFDAENYFSPNWLYEIREGADATLESFRFFFSQTHHN